MAGNVEQGSRALEWSAAFTQDILLPLRPTSTSGHNQHRTHGHRRRTHRSILFARLDDIFVLLKNVISVGTIIGPGLWLVYFWRRLTTRAVVIQMVVSIMTTAVIPAVGPMFDVIRANPHLTVQSPERVYMITTGAVREDVALGRADSVGQMIEKRVVQPPVAVF
jgi:hypothetical protein